MGSGAAVAGACVVVGAGVSGCDGGGASALAQPNVINRAKEEVKEVFMPSGLGAYHPTDKPLNGQFASSSHM